MALSKVSTGGDRGEGGGVGGKVGRLGRLGRGRPPRTLHPTTLCLLGHSGGGASGLGITGWELGGGGGSVALLAGLASPFQTSELTGGMGAHGACVLARWEI